MLGISWCNNIRTDFLAALNKCVCRFLSVDLCLTNNIFSAKKSCTCFTRPQNFVKCCTLVVYRELTSRCAPTLVSQRSIRIAQQQYTRGSTQGSPCQSRGTCWTPLKSRARCAKGAARTVAAAPSPSLRCLEPRTSESLTALQSSAHLVPRIPRRAACPHRPLAECITHRLRPSTGQREDGCKQRSPRAITA